mmetsp:Transcript_16402/g.33816  ORF Transcript_16402/g.33816 Transcript_16402/m.33816 type:complete len:153 (-) Transcript_16402:78-536(-)
MRSILASLLLALSVHGKELEVSNWITPPRSDVPYYPEFSADVGDTIVFTWNENLINDVHIHPTGDCVEDDAVLVGYQSGATYTFTTADGGKELFFANDVGRRCEDGQNIKVLVSEATGAQISSIQEGVSTASSIRAFSALTLTVGVAATLIL